MLLGICAERKSSLGGPKQCCRHGLCDEERGGVATSLCVCGTYRWRVADGVRWLLETSNGGAPLCCATIAAHDAKGEGNGCAMHMLGMLHVLQDLVRHDVWVLQGCWMLCSDGRSLNRLTWNTEYETKNMAAGNARHDQLCGESHCLTG